MTVYKFAKFVIDAYADKLEFCPVCENDFTGSVYKCSHDHFWCGSCQVGWTNPSCPGYPGCDSTERTRDRIAEDCLPQLMVTCRWDHCGAKFMPHVRQVHELACDHREMACGQCDIKCHPSKLLDHFVRVHEVKAVDYDGEWEFSQESGPPSNVWAHLICLREVGTNGMVMFVYSEKPREGTSDRTMWARVLSFDWRIRKPIQTTLTVRGTGASISCARVPDVWSTTRACMGNDLLWHDAGMVQTGMKFHLRFNVTTIDVPFDIEQEWTAVLGPAPVPESRKRHLDAQAEEPKEKKAKPSPVVEVAPPAIPIPDAKKPNPDGQETIRQLLEKMDRIRESGPGPSDQETLSQIAAKVDRIRDKEQADRKKDIAKQISDRVASSIARELELGATGKAKFRQLTGKSTFEELRAQQQEIERRSSRQWALDLARTQQEQAVKGAAVPTSMFRPPARPCRLSGH